MNDLLSSRGKGTVFIRFFLIAADEGDGAAALRECQDRGVAQVENRGLQISLPYIRKQTQAMTQAKLIVTRRVKKHYQVALTTSGEKFLKKILKSDWGMSADMTPEVTDQDTDEVADTMVRCGGIILSDKVSRPAWSYLMNQSYAKGFFASGSKITVTTPDGKKTKWVIP